MTIDTAFRDLLRALESAAHFEEHGDRRSADDYYQLANRLMNDFYDATLEDVWLCATIEEARRNRSMNSYIRRNYPQEWARAIETREPVKIHWGVGTLAIIPCPLNDCADVYSVTLDYASA